MAIWGLNHASRRLFEKLKILRTERNHIVDYFVLSNRREHEECQTKTHQSQIQTANR